MSVRERERERETDRQTDRQRILGGLGRNESRVSDQKGVSLLYIIVEIHHSGRTPSKRKRVKTMLTL